MTIAHEAFATLEDALAARPASLTVERALSLLPRLEIDPEWQRQYDARELPEGLMGLCGMLQAIWPETRMTAEEADWILRLRETGSMRWLANIVLYDSNQMLAVFLIEAAEAVEDQP